MRENKFRGKRLDNGEWAYGQYLYDDVTGKGWIILSITESQKTDGGLFVFCVEVDPATVGQYTGQKDINGVEIYEGDIIFSHHIADKKAGPVAFSNIHHGYIIKYPSEKGHDRWQFMHGKEHCYEIIGNLPDNSELLGKTGKG